jgi:hypothetical protein
VFNCSFFLIFQDALQAQMVLNRISEIIDSPTPTPASNVNSSVHVAPDKLDNATSVQPDQENNVSIVSWVTEPIT